MEPLSQGELLQKLLFDPHLDKKLTEFDECFRPLGSENDLPKLGQIILSEDVIKEVASWQDLIEDINIGKNDFTLLPELLDQNYENLINLNKEILFGFLSRENEVIEFNEQLEKLVKFFKPYYKELHEKWMKLLFASALKYPKIEIYQLLKRLIQIEVLKYQRVYMVHGNKGKQIFLIQIASPDNLTTDEAKKKVIDSLTSTDSFTKDYIASDLLFGWYCWVKRDQGLSSNKILSEWAKEEFPDKMQYNETTLVTRYIRDYKKTYPEYFQNK